MMKSMAAAGALAIAVSFAGAAQAQSYISDWGIADMRQAVIAAGATVTREDNSKDPYVAATAASGLKFTITGRVCEGADGAKRCKGALFQTSFTMDSDSEVDVAVKTWNNALSDVGDRTLIEPGSPAFNVMGTLRNGDWVRFSGRFFPDQTDCVREPSMTIRGTMTSPEFIFRFDDIRRVDLP
jgi:hypothetical protein